MNTTAASTITPPLDSAQTLKVQDALSGLTAAQLQWVSGYVAGLAAGQDTAPVQTDADPASTLTILFGSQTGNGRVVAQELERSATGRGINVKLTSLADYRPANIKRESLLSLVISTHGEGDPPDDAELFHEFLQSDKAPELKDLRYSILALGDSSYVNYCQTGRELDARLKELGASEILPLVECDLDYETPAAQWVDQLLEALPDDLSGAARVPRLHAVKPAALYDKRHPFAAEVLTKQQITGAGSSKEVCHVELSLEGSGLKYEPGDSLAVIANNPPRLIDAILDALQFSGDEQVRIDDTSMSIREAFRTKLEITASSLGFLRAYSKFAESDALSDLLTPARQSGLSEFLETHQIIDVIRHFPASPGPNDFAASLRKLMPRSYSIASSLHANPDEVHLTVAAVNYEAFGTEHWGAASTMLTDRIDEGDSVSVFIEPNPRFHLPADGQTPIIMIGPGTGVAPFRAFVEQRAELGSSGKNWLFFGERNFRSDFLYQLEWQRYLKSGALHRMDVAFSRDQEDKVYVQHRIAERGAEVLDWLQRGAVVYVCGDAKHMAGDVHQALIDVLLAHGGHNAASAESYLKDMRRSGRYQRDVY